MPARNEVDRPDLLVLSPQLAPPAGGVERMADDIFDAFSDWNVRLVGVSSTPRTDPRVRVVPSRARYFLAAWSELRRGPKVVQVMTWRAGIPTLFVRRRPTVLFCHGGELIRSAGGAAEAALRRRVIARMTRIAANSPFTANLVREVSGREATLVPPALRTLPADPTPVAHDGLSILSVGRLVKNKGHDRLLRAFAAAQGNASGAVLTIVGSGPEETALRALANELDVADAVTFAGAVSDEERDELYRRADIFALLSTPVGDEVEGFGIVFLEAAAYGLPVVAGRSGGSDSAVAHETSGFVCDDTEAAAEALSRLAKDPALRRRLGAAGQQRVNEFSLERFRAQLEALYVASST